MIPVETGTGVVPRFEIDIHWEIQPASLLDCSSEQLWRNQTSVPLLGNSIPTLNPELHLIVVCAHGTRSFWRRLQWIADAARLMSNEHLSWSSVMSMADEMKATRMVVLAAVLSNRLLAVPMPDLPEFKNVDVAVERLADVVIRDLSGLSLYGNSTVLTRWKFFFQLQTSLIDRVACLTRQLFHPTLDDWDLLPLPSIAFNFYYVLHFWSQIRVLILKIMRNLGALDDRRKAELAAIRLLPRSSASESNDQF
jgi:hypothetical protein